MNGEVHPDPFSTRSRARGTFNSAVAESAFFAAGARHSTRPPAHSATFLIRARPSAPPLPILEDETLDSWFR